VVIGTSSRNWLICGWLSVSVAIAQSASVVQPFVNPARDLSSCGQGPVNLLVDRVLRHQLIDDDRPTLRWSVDSGERLIVAAQRPCWRVPHRDPGKRQVDAEAARLLLDPIDLDSRRHGSPAVHAIFTPLADLPIRQAERLRNPTDDVEVVNEPGEHDDRLATGAVQYVRQASSLARVHRHRLAVAVR
jgi:hypothetical protein